MCYVAEQTASVRYQRTPLYSSVRRSRGVFMSCQKDNSLLWKLAGSSDERLFVQPSEDCECCAECLRLR
jgi:hypothetical protein